MIIKERIVKKLQEELEEIINEKEIIEEAYYLNKEEIDENLISVSLIELIPEISLVRFFYYKDITIYLICNIDSDGIILIGGLKENELLFCSKWTK